MKSFSLRNAFVLICLIMMVVSPFSCSELGILAIKDHPHCCIPEKAAVKTAEDAYNLDLDRLEIAEDTFNAKVNPLNIRTSAISTAITNYLSNPTDVTLDLLQKEGFALTAPRADFFNSVIALDAASAAVYGGSLVTLNEKTVALFACNLACHKDNCCVSLKTSVEAARLRLDRLKEILAYEEDVFATLEGLEASLDTEQKNARATYNIHCPSIPLTLICTHADTAVELIEGLFQAIRALKLSRKGKIDTTNAFVLEAEAELKTLTDQLNDCVNGCPK